MRDRDGEARARHASAARAGRHAAAGEASAGADPEVVAHGFRAGMLTAAGVTAAALVGAAAWMPGWAARPSAELVREGARGC